MMFGGTSCASSALASMTPLSASTADTASAYPVTTLLRGLHMRDVVLPGISGDETAGEVGTVTLVFRNPDVVPEVGDPLEVRYFSEVLFAGTITQIERTIDPSHSLTLYNCTATDFSQVLVRRKVRRSFTDLSVPQLIAALLENELSGEGFLYGSSDNAGLMELVDADNVSTFDILRDVAGITGQVLYVDYDKTIRFRATSNPTAPFDVKNATVQDVSVRVDRETYRNVQTVIAKGTAPEGSEAIEVQVIAENTEQIAERASIEGGSGRYEQMDEVTHPSSNAQTTLSRLADTYATVLLAVGGTPRKTMRVSMKEFGLYGFRAGQVASVDLTGLGLVGMWLIQKVTWREQDGTRLVYKMELVESSLQQRAWESWASIYRAGKLVVTLPGAGLSANVASFTTPGSTQWVSPITGTITITTMGGSGGGCYLGHSGKGGSSGKTVSSITVVLGDVLDLTVGAKGAGGTVVSRTGFAGSSSAVLRGSVEVSWAGGGGGAPYSTPGIGTPGGGRNGVVTVGGGKIGGSYGTSSHYDGFPGVDGSIEIEY
jgi:hypothetical protein